LSIGVVGVFDAPRKRRPEPRGSVVLYTAVSFVYQWRLLFIGLRIACCNRIVPGFCPQSIPQAQPLREPQSRTNSSKRANTIGTKSPVGPSIEQSQSRIRRGARREPSSAKGTRRALHHDLCRFSIAVSMTANTPSQLWGGDPGWPFYRSLFAAKECDPGPIDGMQQDIPVG